MNPDPVCVVPARMAGLAEAIAWVETFCRACGVSGDDSLRLSLVVEELFTNTVTHGYGGESEAPVRIGLRADPAEIELSFEDEAPPFDPLAHLAGSAAAVGGAGPDRPVGRLGIALVVGMALRIDYARDGGCNRIRVALRRGG